MTLFDYEELCGYWAKNPPTHLMVAAYLGVGKPADAQTSQQSPKSQKEAIAEILKGGGTAIIDQRIFEKGMPIPTFNFNELMSRRPESRTRPALRA